MSADISSKFIKAFPSYLFLEKGNKNITLHQRQIELLDFLD